MRVYLALCSEYDDIHIIGVYRDKSVAEQVAKAFELRTLARHDTPTEHIRGHVQEFDVR